MHFLCEIVFLRSHINRDCKTCINCHLYHYAGNNPVKYVDPDGRMAAPILVPIFPPPIILPPMNDNGNIVGGGFVLTPYSSQNSMIPLLPPALSSWTTIFPQLDFIPQLTLVFFLFVSQAPG